VTLPLDRLEAQVLELPLRERARLAQRLLESLDEDADEDPAEVEQAWVEEAERRYERYLAGDTQPIPPEEALARVRARLKSR
jgi:putative addiction module component (TIGR02574 family)